MRFLVTSSDLRFWPERGDVYLLGEWCRWNLNEEKLSPFNIQIASAYSVLACQRKRDIEAINHIYEDCLLGLTKSLNSFHRTSYTIRYWRILIGSWLYLFCVILYNRWNSFWTGLKNQKIDSVKILQAPDEEFVPAGFLEFSALYRTEIWNQKIFSIIVENYANLPFEKVSVPSRLNYLKNQPNNLKYAVTSMPRKLISVMSRSIAPILNKFSHDTDALLISTYLPRWVELFLQVKLKQFPIFRFYEPVINLAPDLKLRKKVLKHKSRGSNWQSFLKTMIQKGIPTCYLEGYKELKSKAFSAGWPTNPKFIFTSNSFDSHEPFKAYTAELVEKGIPYIIGQHGANYGTSFYKFSERHEIKTSDRFLTWGWKNHEKQVHPAFAFPFIFCKKNIAKKTGNLLLVQKQGGHRTSPWDEFHLLKKYLEDQFLFTKKLKKKIFRQTIVRLSSSNLFNDWSEETHWRNRFPELKIDQGFQDINKLVKKSRLMVFSFISTGFLEALYRDTPVILFFNLKDYPLRPESRPFFKSLQEAEIFFTSPFQAAKKVNEVWEKIETWWNKTNTKVAKEKFKKQYVNKNEKPITEIKKLLLLEK